MKEHSKRKKLHSDFKMMLSIPVFSWALYDFSNTIFSANITTLFFPQYVTDVFGKDPVTEQLASTWIAYASSIAALLLIACSPLMGVYIDQTKKKKRWVVVFSMIVFLCTLFMGIVDQLGLDGVVGNIPLSMLLIVILFTIAKFMYNAALIFYDAMMSSLAPKANHSVLSGFGVALGYLGTLFGVLTIMLFVGTKDAGKTFIPTALMFLVFSLPLFFFTKDKNVVKMKNKISMMSGYKEVIETYKEAKHHKSIYLFLIVYFFLNDSLATAISMMQPYATTVMGFSSKAFIGIFMIATIFSVIGAFVFGYIAERVTSVIAMLYVAFILMVALVLASLPLPQWTFYICAILFGIAMGSIWVISRTLIIELAPEGKEGQFFGLFSMSGKLSAVIGPFIYGTITWSLSDYGPLASRIAILSLLVMAIFAVIVHMKVLKEVKKHTF